MSLRASVGSTEAIGKWVGSSMSSVPLSLSTREQLRSWFRRVYAGDLAVRGPLGFLPGHACLLVALRQIGPLLPSLDRPGRHHAPPDAAIGYPSRTAPRTGRDFSRFLTGGAYETYETRFRRFRRVVRAGIPGFRARG